MCCWPGCELGLVTARGKQRTDSTHVISAVRDLNRLELAGELVRAAVEALSVAAPGWLPTMIDLGDWAKRYGARSIPGGCPALRPSGGLPPRSTTTTLTDPIEANSATTVRPRTLWGQTPWGKCLWGDVKYQVGADIVGNVASARS